MKFKAVRLLLYVLVVFAIYPCIAQNHAIDSLRDFIIREKEDTDKVKALNILSRKLYNAGKYDSAQTCAENALALAEKLEFTSGRIDAISMEGNVSWGKGDYSKSLEYHLKAIDLSKEIGSKLGIASNMNSIGTVYELEGNYTKALDYYLQALSLFKEMNKKEGISRVYCALGNIYAEQFDNKKSIEYAQKSLAMDSEAGNLSGVATNLINLGVTYDGMGEDAKALINYKRALTIENKLGEIDAIATILSDIGLIYIGQDSTRQALEYYTRALNISRQVGDKDGVAAFLVGVGTVYSRMKNYTKAKSYLDSGVNLSKAIGVKDIIRNAYVEITRMDTLTGNFKQGMYDYKMYVIYRDSLVNEASTQKRVQTEMNYEFDQKQAAAKAEQDKKDTIAEQDKKRQLVIRDAFMVGFALMLALAFFIFRGYKQKQKANSIITQQKALVEQQKELVEVKNKEVLDSINYAKRLQDAILPPLSLIEKKFPESFLLYKPKDIVAGDFYWLEKAGDNILIAAADCTGHGVPGALVSVVCSNALNRTVKEFKITEPGKILDKVRELVLETFEKSEDNVQDGMDISLASLNPFEGGTRINWAGAYNPLWYVQHGQIHEVAGDKQPIGKTDRPQSFNTHTLNLNKGDTLYLFTDGYADQFGGEKGKKFKYKALQEKLVLISQQPMAEQKRILETTLNEWKGNLEQVDDILIIGIRV